MILKSVGPVVGDVEIEVAVAIHISQCQRSGAESPRQPAIGHLCEAAFAVIQKRAGAAAQAVHQQIQIAVAVDVGEHAAGRELVRTGDPGPGRDVLEPPIPEVAIEHVVAFKPAEIDVHPAVAIDIAERHTRADFVEAVGGHRGIRQPVAEGNPGVAGLQQREARVTARRNRQRGETIAGALLPDKIGSRVSDGGGQPGQREERKEGSEVCAHITAHGHADPRALTKKFQGMP